MFLILLSFVFIIPSLINSQSLQVLSPPELRAQLKEGTNFIKTQTKTIIFN